MTDFDQASLRSELSQEPINERETGRLLERLTAFDLGEAMPTLGAVAEATGHTVEEVAAQLVAIRADTDPALKERVERLEGVVVEHERRLDASPLVHPKPIVGPYGRQHFKDKGEDTTVLIFVAVLCVIMLTFFAFASTVNQKSSPKCFMDGKPVSCSMLPPIP